MGVPLNHPFYRVFPYKPTFLGYTRISMETPMGVYQKKYTAFSWSTGRSLAFWMSPMQSSINFAILSGFIASSCDVLKGPRVTFEVAEMPLFSHEFSNSGSKHGDPMISEISTRSRSKYLRNRLIGLELENESSESQPDSEASHIYTKAMQ